MSNISLRPPSPKSEISKPEILHPKRVCHQPGTPKADSKTSDELNRSTGPNIDLVLKIACWAHPRTKHDKMKEGPVKGSGASVVGTSELEPN